MKKQRFILIAAALAALSLSSACSLIYDSESSDISSDSVDTGIGSSEVESDSSVSSSEPVISSQGKPESSGQSSDENGSVVFSEEDREVQKILSDMMEPANDVYSWTHGPDIDRPAFKFRLPSIDTSMTFTCYPFSASDESEHLLERPDTYSELKEMMLEYFSADQTEHLLLSFVVCSAAENSDGTYTLKKADGTPIELLPGLFEVDGKLYQIETRGPGEIIKYISIDLDTVKMAYRTDDQIEFMHLDNEFDNSETLNDMKMYSKLARCGILKYERGGWKLDSWDLAKAHL